MSISSSIWTKSTKPEVKKPAPTNPLITQIQSARCPYIVIVTGGIASGKSTVCALFEELGVPVVDTDIIAREIVDPGQPALATIASEFGSQYLLADGSLDRSRLRGLIFSDPDAKKILESITHPLIREGALQQLEQTLASYCLLCIPLFTESGASWPHQRVLVINTEPAIQVARVMARDKCSELQAKAIVASQASNAERLALADDIVQNDGDLDSLKRAVAKLHNTYIQLAKNNLPS